MREWRLSIILRNNFEERGDGPSEFQQTFLQFHPFSPSFSLPSSSLSLFLDLVLRRDTAAGDKFRIPVVLFVTIPEANLLLSFMHYRRSLPFCRPSTESGDVVLVHSYFGTNIMLIPYRRSRRAPIFVPAGGTKHRCCMPMVIDG